MKTLYKNIALFVGGSLFGSAGIKLLGSNDAKNAYTHAAAAVLRMKDCVMNTVDTVRENADDILHAAKDIKDCAEEIADEMAADAAPAEA